MFGDGAKSSMEGSPGSSHASSTTNIVSGRSRAIAGRPDRSCCTPDGLLGLVLIHDVPFCSLKSAPVSSALASKAQACYKGTQGTASVKMTVAPSGKVTKVTIGGAFAGKPEGQCVSALAQSATFPPWDGGPQTVNYSYLLSE